MSELLPVLETLVADIEADRPVALCAIVKTKGSTPQSPGAAMLVRADMTTLGTLGGGCVEADVRQQAFKLMQDGRSGLLDFVLNHDYGWDDGLICGGRMFVAVMSVQQPSNEGAMPTALGGHAQPATDMPKQARRHGARAAHGAAAGARIPSCTSTTELLAEYRAALALARARRPATVPIVIDHQGAQQTYALRIEPPPTLLIAGAGHVGGALARLAVDLDFHVVIIDDRADLASPERFPAGVEVITGDIAQSLRNHDIHESSYVVVVTRGHQHDHQALEAVIRRPARYIGMIGSKRKSRMILKDLTEAGVSPEMVDRVRTPIGLPIEAVTVPEIAISIAAELIQARRQTPTPIVEGPFTASTPRAHRVEVPR
jgi:xanthine dehydrogenase accessory factor